MLQPILKKRNTYYSNLSENGQKKFEFRLQEFMRAKTFIGRQNLVVTDEMRILISAAAVQLTFGLEQFTFSNLHTINIFPGIFHSKLYNASFKGLTTRDGVISLSWEHFLAGYATDTDKLNLGLHELAHALHIDLSDKKRINTHFSEYAKKWKRGALNDFYKLKAGRLPFLRSYGNSNLYEFFAVCVEHFFEMPEEFQAQLPNLYGHTAFLLNQDPSNTSEDYQLRKDFDYFIPDSGETKLLTDGNINKNQPETEGGKFQQFIRQKGLYVAMGITLCGFIGIPILFWFSSVIIINTGPLLFMLFGCGMLGLIQWNFVREHIDMAYHQFAMYAFVGFGITLVNLLLLLNYTTTINSYSQTYTIARKGYYSDIIIMDGKPNLALERNLNTFADEHMLDVESIQKIEITFDTGLLGFDKIRECKFN